MYQKTFPIHKLQRKFKGNIVTLTFSTHRTVGVPGITLFTIIIVLCVKAKFNKNAKLTEGFTDD